MNTPPPSDTDSASFNGFGAYRRKREPSDSPEAKPRSFRRIPRDEFSGSDPSDRPPRRDRGDADGDAPSAGRPPRPYGGRKPFGKKPFGKKPFGKKASGFKKGSGFRKPFPGREFDTIEDGEAPPPAESEPFFRRRPVRQDGDGDREAPRADRSFKHAPRRYGDRPEHDGEGGHGHFKPFRGKKPFGKPFGKKPFGKGRRPFRESSGEEAATGFDAPRPLRRPYGAPVDGEFSAIPDFDAAPPPSGRKPFGKKVFGKKPFNRKPFGKKAFGKKLFGSKPFGKKKPFGGKSFGKKPFGKKSGKRPGPRD